jgi:hypothetical protein
MSKRPSVALDATALQRVLGRSRVPKSTSVEGRVVLIAEAAEALMNDRLPSMESRIFLAGALSSWLQQGGDLSRDFLQVIRPKSKRTASKIFQEIQRENSAHPDEGAESDEAGESARDSQQEN